MTDAAGIYARIPVDRRRGRDGVEAQAGIHVWLRQQAISTRQVPAAARTALPARRTSPVLRRSAVRGAARAASGTRSRRHRHPSGQQPPEIIEIGALPISQDTGVDLANLRTWLIRPTRPITPLVSRKVHRIHNRDVADAPLWADVAEDIAATIDGRAAVAHNASVERRVLGAHLPEWSPPFVLDTLRLAKTVWPGLPGGYGMDRLIQHAGLTPPPERHGAHRHRAGYDAWMTAQLLIVLLGHADLDWPRVTAAACLPEFTGNDTEQGGLW